MRKFRIVFNNQMERIITAKWFYCHNDNTTYSFEGSDGEFIFFAPVVSVAYIEVI